MPERARCGLLLIGTALARLALVALASASVADLALFIGPRVGGDVCRSTLTTTTWALSNSV